MKTPRSEDPGYKHRGDEGHRPRENTADPNGYWGEVFAAAGFTSLTSARGTIETTWTKIKSLWTENA